MYSYLKFPSEVYHRHMPNYTVAYYSGLFFGIDRQSKAKQYASCLTYPYPHNDHLNSADLHQVSGTSFGKK